MNSESSLFDYFNRFSKIEKGDFELLTENLKPKTFKKGAWLIQPGQVQRELYFVKAGVQVSYFESDKKIHVMAFTYAPGLCAIPDSLMLQSPSRFYLKCLSDSVCDCISHAAMLKVFDHSQAVERLFRRMAEMVLAGVIQRHLELHTLSIEERFKIFCKRSPHLLQNVPHKYIASYLGIDPTNFSKLFNSVKI